MYKVLMSRTANPRTLMTRHLTGGSSIHGEYDALDFRRRFTGFEEIEPGHGEHHVSLNGTSGSHLQIEINSSASTTREQNGLQIAANILWD